MLVGEKCVSILELNFSSDHSGLPGICPVDICRYTQWCGKTFRISELSVRSWVIAKPHPASVGVFVCSNHLKMT